jgi:hypothetical protein
MKGSNVLRLNADTLCEALQEYFDKRTTAEGRFKVRSIGFKPEIPGVPVYEVTIGEPQPVAGEGRGETA